MFAVGAGGHFLSNEKDAMLLIQLRGTVDELEAQNLAKDTLIKKLKVMFHTCAFTSTIVVDSIRCFAPVRKHKQTMCNRLSWATCISAHATSLNGDSRKASES